MFNVAHNPVTNRHAGWITPRDATGQQFRAGRSL